MRDVHDEATPVEEPGEDEVRTPPRFRVSVAVGLTVFTSVALAAIGALNRAAVETETAVAGATQVLENGGSSRDGSSAADQYGSGTRVTMCSDGSTVRVREAAVPALLGRGATRGSCSTD